MNPFTTDHPLQAEPFQRSHRARRWLVLAVLSYPAWLIALGPFCQLDQNDRLHWLPQSFRQAFYWPAMPLLWATGEEGFYMRYLNLWHEDPYPTETTR